LFLALDDAVSGEEAGGSSGLSGAASKIGGMFGKK